MLPEQTGNETDPHPSAATGTENESLDDHRLQLLQRLSDWLEGPMLVLAFIWLALLVIELIWGANGLFEALGTIIWIVFIADFAFEFALAPHKPTYLRQNWLTALALVVPALRLFRITRVLRVFRMARATRGLRLLRVVSSLNRGMGALGASLGRRGFGYVVSLTVLVTLAGAAGMYTFENEAPGGITSYGEALWWTGMIMTTMGSQYWPVTVEGRVLCVLLALYAFGVFGYVTAALATFFVGRDAQNPQAELAGAKAVAELKAEIVALRREVRSLHPTEQSDPD